MTTTAPDNESVTIRKAQRADLIEVHRIEGASFEQPWPFKAFDRFLDEPGFLVAEEEEDSIAGYVVADTARDRNRKLGHVKDLAVRPNRRNRGIGSRLLERSLRVLAAQGVSRVKLEVRETNEGARELYDRFGFDRHHIIPGYYEDGEDAIVLLVNLHDRH